MKLFQIKMANTAIERLSNQKCRSLGLTGTQAAVLDILYQSDNKVLCQRDIEKALGLTHPTVSSILSRLTENGYIETKSLLEDHRCNEIVLTAKGKKCKNKLSSTLDELSLATFQDFSTSELKQLEEYLERIQKNLSEYLK